ncbi:PilW family protein [Pseudoalteromonas sp. SW0106-04]|uniref:PilW family protein n=1 Tax=Pseudoalteromonas sp. SW0106-04 TaxID=1702169 RepID=UPI0006B4D49C|nr:prepilin-type N-terminal cleavage/methylation domain-containing protein [Pseudoalteromonas sp. SW0106-04]
MHNEKGFTLIEVLVASVILFASLALISDLFRGSMLTADKAANNADFYQTHPAAISAIKTSLRDKFDRRDAKPLSGEVYIFGIIYKWQAEPIKYESRQRFFDDPENLPARFAIYRVQVIASKNSKEQHFSFEVSAW